METIVINGTASFTGYWMSKKLVESKKYKVVAILSKKKEKYKNLKKKRLNYLKPFKLHNDAKFGSKKYLKILSKYNNFIYKY